MIDVLVTWAMIAIAVGAYLAGRRSPPRRVGRGAPVYDRRAALDGADVARTMKGRKS